MPGRPTSSHMVLKVLSIRSGRGLTTNDLCVYTTIRLILISGFVMVGHVWRSKSSNWTCCRSVSCRKFASESPNICRSFTYPFPYFPRDRYGNYLWAGKKTLTSHSSAGLSSINSIPSKKNSWKLQLLFYTIVFILHQQKGLQNHNLKSPAKISCENAKRKISKNDGFVQRFLNKVEKEWQ